MCGIFGSISDSRITIDKNILPHRGPDDWGVEYYSDFGVNTTLFQSRLSIIGLGKQGHQPFKKYADYVMLFNGEIFNYKEIQQSLIDDLDISFVTNTDTEVLYESLVNYGTEATLQKLNGMFTFAFYNRTKGELVIARDHVGIKPLYICTAGNSFYFTSEIKVLFELNLFKPVLRKELLGEYFANGWLYEPDTLFKDVYKIESGHFIQYNYKDRSFVNTRYWDINYDPGISADENYISQVIHNQTVSDVPLGIYFSGGIDSSIIAEELLDKKPFLLNLDLGTSESQRVDLFQKMYNVNIAKCQYSEKEFCTYEKLVYNLDEPVADPAIVPAYTLAKEARNNGRVVMLSGMGGDEIDAGYTRHKIIMNLGLYKLFKYVPVFDFYPAKVKRDLIRLKNFISNPVYSNYFSMTSYFSRNDIDELTGSDEWFNKYEDKIGRIGLNSGDTAKDFFYLDYKGFLSSHNLLYMDKASMAASVEVRVPLLDKNIVNYFFKTIKHNKGSKPRLTRILKNKLGENYSEGKKSGFTYPVDKWMAEYDWDKVISYFNGVKILNTAVLKRYVDLLKEEPSNHAMKLFAVYTLYIWLKTFNIEVH